MAMYNFLLPSDPHQCMKAFMAIYGSSSISKVSSVNSHEIFIFLRTADFASGQKL